MAVRFEAAALLCHMYALLVINSGYSTRSLPARAITNKQTDMRAMERCPMERQEQIDLLNAYPADYFVCIDECHIVQDDMGIRSRGWGPKGVRIVAEQARTGGTRKRFSTLAVFTTDGFIGPYHIAYNFRWL